MDPFTMFLAAIAGGGKLMEGAAGSRVAGINAAIQADNVALAQLQAKGAREDANLAYEKGAFDQVRLRRQVSAVVGGQTAHFAANNLDPGWGSPLLLASRTVTQGETDAELIGVNAAFEASRALSRAASFDANAATASYGELAAREKQRSSMIAGYIGAGTSMLLATRGTGFGATGFGANYQSNPFVLNQPADI